MNRPGRWYSVPYVLSGYLLGSRRLNSRPERTTSCSPGPHKESATQCEPRDSRTVIVTPTPVPPRRREGVSPREASYSLIQNTQGVESTPLYNAAVRLKQRIQHDIRRVAGDPDAEEELADILAALCDDLDSLRWEITGAQAMPAVAKRKVESPAAED